MSKETKSSQGSTHAGTPSKKQQQRGSSRKASGGNGSAIAVNNRSAEKPKEGERKSSSRSKKQHKEKEKEPKKKENVPGSSNEKPKKDDEKKSAGVVGSDHKAASKKEVKEQKSNLPTEFEEIKATRRPAVSKTKRKHLQVGEEAITPSIAPVAQYGQAAAAATAPVSTPPNDGVEDGGVLTPDSSTRIHGSKKSAENVKTPELEAPAGIKLSKELIRTSSKERCRNSSKEVGGGKCSNKEVKHESNKEVKRESNKEMPAHSESLVPKTLFSTPGIIQNVTMFTDENPNDDDGNVKKH